MNNMHPNGIFNIHAAQAMWSRAMGAGHPYLPDPRMRGPTEDRGGNLKLDTGTSSSVFPDHVSPLHLAVGEARRKSNGSDEGSVKDEGNNSRPTSPPEGGLSPSLPPSPARDDIHDDEGVPRNQDDIIQQPPQNLTKFSIMDICLTIWRLLSRESTV